MCPHLARLSNDLVVGEHNRLYLGKQGLDLEPCPLPWLCHGRRLAVEEHFAVGRALDEGGAEQRQPPLFQFGIGVVGDAGAQGEDLGEQQAVRDFPRPVSSPTSRMSLTTTSASRRSGSDAWAGMTTRSERASALYSVTSRVPGRSMQMWSYCAGILLVAEEPAELRWSYGGNGEARDRVPSGPAVQVGSGRDRSAGRGRLRGKCRSHAAHVVDLPTPPFEDANVRIMQNLNNDLGKCGFEELGRWAINQVQGSGFVQSSN